MAEATESKGWFNAGNISAFITVVSVVGGGITMSYTFGNWTSKVDNKLEYITEVNKTQAVSILRDDLAIQEIRNEMKTVQLARSIELAKIEISLEALKKFVGIDDVHIFPQNKGK